jgi:hypothetical protein
VNLYGNEVSYECSYSNVITIASVGLNGTFSCGIMRTLESKYSISVNLKIKSKTTGISVFLSRNSLEFFFLDKIQLLSIDSHAETFIETTPKKRNVKLFLSDNLITTQSVYCQFTSNEGVLYSKAEYILGSQRNISCEIQKNTFAQLVEVIDVQLWINSSDVFFFRISSNNQSYLFIKDNILWNTKKVIEPASLATELKFSPLRDQFKYELRMTADALEATTLLIDCNFNLGMKVKCNLPKSYLESLKFVPIKLNFKFSVIHMFSNQRLEVNVDNLNYYRTIEFEHVKPYFISYNERLNYPLRMIGNTFSSLNSTNYQFLCNSKQILLLTKFHKMETHQF